MLYLSLSCAIDSFSCCNRSTRKVEILIINKVLALPVVRKEKVILEQDWAVKRNIRLLDFYVNTSSPKTSKSRFTNEEQLLTTGDNLYAHVKLAMFLSKLVFPTQALSRKEKQKVRHCSCFNGIINWELIICYYLFYCRQITRLSCAKKNIKKKIISPDRALIYFCKLGFSCYQRKAAAMDGEGGNWWRYLLQNFQGWILGEGRGHMNCTSLFFSIFFLFVRLDGDELCVFFSYHKAVKIGVRGLILC